MQPNKTKIALVIGALLLGTSGASNAATGTFNITVNTIADVVLTEETPLDYGTNIFTTAGTCVMSAVTPGHNDMQIDSAGTAAATAYGDLSGGGCVNGAALGTPGLYKISGTGGATVNITLNGITATDFTFTPDSNAFASYGATGAAGTVADDTLGALSTVAPTAVRTPDATEAAQPEVTVGEVLFTLGGTLTVLNPLTALTTYNAETFVVSVVY